MSENGKNVLIIEDIKAYQVLIKNLVVDFGFNVIEVLSSAEKAVNFILENNRELDLIVLDSLIESHKEGCEIAKKINKETSIPLIFLTIPEYGNRTFELNSGEKVFLNINKYNGDYYEHELKKYIKLSLNKYKSNQKLKNDEKIIKN